MAKKLIELVIRHYQSEEATNRKTTRKLNDEVKFYRNQAEASNGERCSHVYRKKRVAS